MTHFSRRTFLLGTTLSAATSLLAACSSTSTDTPTAPHTPSASGTYPVTIEHAYGSTTLETAPERIVGIGWINGDILAALGVIPVAQAAVAWGGNANDSTDWFDAKVAELGATPPVRLHETDGIDFAGIAAARPDLIVNVIGGMSEEDYVKLSTIAPVVTYTKDGANWTTSWQDATRIMGKALGKNEEAATVIADTEAAMTAAAQRYPALAGATFLATAIDPSDGTIGVYSPADLRPRFFEAIGMTPAAVMDTIDFPAGSFYTTFSAERADELLADVVYTWAADDSVEAAILAHPLLRQIPAASQGGLFVDPIKAHANAFGTSPLAIMWLLDSPFLSELAAHAEASRS